MRLLFAALALAGLTACQSNENKTKEETKKDSAQTTTPATTESNKALTTTEQNEGWQLLFDGNSKKGWHVYNNKSDGSAWVVADGALHLDPKQSKDFQTVGGGDIVTNDEYDNFDLKLEWKIADSGNSGILFYVKEDPKYEHTFHTGPEMQVLDNNGHPDAKIPKHRAGDLYDLISSSPETVKKAGEWNEVEVISNKGALEFHLNGPKVLSTTLWDDNWRKLIAGSKFKQWKDFGTFKKGRIALQDHGNKVWYRNVKIKKL
jgi:hypothetical protein